MTIGGWIIFVLSNLFVLTLCVWCLYKVVIVPERPDDAPESDSLDH